MFTVVPLFRRRVRRDHSPGNRGISGAGAEKLHPIQCAEFYAEIVKDRLPETMEGAAGNPTEPGKSTNSDHKSLPPAGEEDDGVVY